MNKNLLILPAMVFTMGLASCAKTVSKDEALKFVTENYKNSARKTITKAKATWDFGGSTGDTGKYIARTLVVILTDGKSEELKGSYEESDPGLVATPLNKDNFYRYSSGYNFVLKGKELTLKWEEIDSGVTVKEELTHNSDGYPYRTKEVVENFKIDDSNSVKGSLELNFSF